MRTFLIRKIYSLLILLLDVSFSHGSIFERMTFRIENSNLIIFIKHTDCVRFCRGFARIPTIYFKILCDFEYFHNFSLNIFIFIIMSIPIYFYAGHSIVIIAIINEKNSTMTIAVFLAKWPISISHRKIIIRVYYREYLSLIAYLHYPFNLHELHLIWCTSIQRNLRFTIDKSYDIIENDLVIRFTAKLSESNSVFWA